ncbi:MAG TPA: polysaccharide deacetylase family protein [Candidatus Limnocylindrales bacterium]|nr:polysaccharide deacetylase family protein [Candidatus Limnocylindrales bacterium]
MTFRVALTFDAEHPDRPTEPGVAESILDHLRDAGVRASFFVQGRWALAYPGTARRIPGGGHLVGNHSHYHAQMPLFSPAGLATDVRDAEAVICDVLGVDPRPWFRCPFGHGHDDPAIVGALAGLGYRTIGWDVVPEDWEQPAAAVEARVVDGVTAFGDGAVVLLHAWPASTGTALPAILARLAGAGARFVGLDELERLPLDTPS